MIQSDISVQQVEELFKKARLSADILSLTACAKGGNNRTYRVETIDGIFAVKKYFRGNADKRDRLKSEFAFLLYAKQAASDFVPAPYAQNSEDGLALYEFIEGHSLTKNEVTENEIVQAIQFFCSLNNAKVKEHAKELSPASEAGFSIQDHLNSVNTRICELQQAVANDTDHDEAAKKVVSRLSEYWQRLVDECHQAAATNHIDITMQLDNSQRCISPSDFGFHNALMMPNNHIKFLDFEYAGWDDPAKMANDFFSQLAVPIPQKYYEWFLSETMKPFPQSDMLITRAKLLKAVYHVKWCCIALNVFIPVHMSRRQFANPNLNVVDLRKTQLAKAELLLNTLEISNYGPY